jgi:two-component system, OmpR family, response regulator QseB
MRVLAAEDNPVFQSLLKTMLTKWGYTAILARDGNEAWSALEAPDAPRLAVLDWMMPGIDGVEICRRLRSLHREPYIYILLLTARTESQDLIEGMDAGADDYLTKPFDLDELAARIRALLRRKSGRAATVLEHLGVVLDPASHRVTQQGVEVALSPREFALLQLLMERPGAILSRAQIEERLYGWGEEVESNAVEVHIHGLRRKLGAQYILTVRGVGYRVRPRG